MAFAVRRRRPNYYPFNIDAGQDEHLYFPTVIEPYRKAANQGHATAQNNLELACISGEEIGGSEHSTTALVDVDWGFLDPVAIFDQDITPPIAKYALPEVGERITSTPQLAYCLSLLHFDTDEKVRLQALAADVVRAFIRDEHKKPETVAEVVCLAAVLERDDFRDLLQAFLVGIEQSGFLDINLLDGLTQLIRNSMPGYLDADDLIKILELLNKHIKDNHDLSIRHPYRLALTISCLLDSMVDSQVEGLSREHLHVPLHEYLEELHDSSDPYLSYQAAYAHQALRYIPDDETILQSMMRRTGKVAQGISGVVSGVKALDLVGFIEELQNVQQ
ncbi:hypothetical protein BGZ80_003858, partial [Entomortierella chlamydospora]